MNEQELICLIALGMAQGVGLASAHKLYGMMGSAEAIFAHRRDLPGMVEGFSSQQAEALADPRLFARAEKEMEFADKHDIRCLAFKDPDYPSRLRDCPDAPLTLFYRGSIPLNARHVIAIVGTRHATEYGRAMCIKLISELKDICPDVLVVSGLAYGIDIAAHRAALDYGFPTVGVLAHGLDRIYPSAHRDTAALMVQQGGLLTEFITGTNPDRQNFVKRNRIVAGMSDATIVVESAAKGGALITADIASSYARECFAFPGPVGAPWSEGCNQLIRNNGATLIQSAADLMDSMMWQNRTPAQPVQRQLFPDLTPEEQRVVDCLRRSPSGVQINTLTVQTDFPINKLTGLLFELEMKGMVTPLAGGCYRVI